MGAGEGWCEWVNSIDPSTHLAMHISCPSYDMQVQSQELIELVAKWRGEEIDIGPLPGHCTVHTVKARLCVDMCSVCTRTQPQTYQPHSSQHSHPPRIRPKTQTQQHINTQKHHDKHNKQVLLEAKTRVRPEKQKLIGLTLAGGKGKQPAPDGAELSALALGGKRPFKFMLMGTPEVCVCGFVLGGVFVLCVVCAFIHPGGCLRGLVGSFDVMYTHTRIHMYI